MTCLLPDILNGDIGEYRDIERTRWIKREPYSQSLDNPQRSPFKTCNLKVYKFSFKVGRLIDPRGPWLAHIFFGIIS